VVGKDGGEGKGDVAMIFKCFVCFLCLHVFFLHFQNSTKLSKGKIFS
jgi:hypothetical protein